jgi:hypothetical protein
MQILQSIFFPWNFTHVRRIDEEHNYKEKNVYFSNMKKIIKHYPMTDRLIVTRGS